MSVAAVTARINELQTQFSLLAQGAAVSGSAAATFAASLASATSASETTSASGTTSATSASSGATGGDAVIAEAKKYLGVPYVWGGTDPEKGLDCSGFVQLVYKNMGYELPRVSYQQATAGRAVEGGLKNAQPGDILAFGSPVHHVALYVGDGKMIEAPRSGLDVRITDVWETPTAVRRVLPASGVDAATSATRTSGVDAGTPYADLFASAGAKYGVSPALLAAVAKQESGYDARAVSPAGAQGLMQLMPATARGLGVSNSFDPTQAVDGAARLLEGLLDQFDRTDLALAAYNAGPGAVQRYGGIPPYAETQNYVRRILADLGDAA